MRADSIKSSVVGVAPVAVPVGTQKALWLWSRMMSWQVRMTQFIATVISSRWSRSRSELLLVSEWTVIGPAPGLALP